MAKNYSWEITISETDYHIACQQRGMQFDFCVDGEFLCCLHAKPDQITEQNVIIGGKCCQVAAYEGVPDVIVDGILTGVEAKEKKNAKKRRILGALGGVFLICIGLFVVFSYVTMTMADVSVVGGAMSAVFGGVFFVVGIILLLSARKKENKYGV